MDDLPELPFEKVLGYLSLEDRLKARAVSRRWYHKINSFKVKSLCYADRPRGFIWGKNRWPSGEFAKNFITSTRFTTFFDTFGKTILSSLQHLRLLGLNLDEASTFGPALNMFGQLKELDIIRFNRPRAASGFCEELELNLPMLASIHLEAVEGIGQLTLNAPRLKRVKIPEYSFSLILKFVHADSVEWLLVDSVGIGAPTEVKNLKNLQYLYVEDLRGIGPTFLASLQQLKEFHTNDLCLKVSELFEQKQRYGRTDLKIYLGGLLMNGPDDPAKDVLYGTSKGILDGEWLAFLAENRPRLADEILFYTILPSLEYIEDVAPDLQVNLLKRFTDLNKIEVDSQVQDIQRFLDLLKNCENIVDLQFWCDQPQDLFDRLPEHCAVQKLSIDGRPADLAFLFRLKHLIDLAVDWSIDSETVRRAFDELPVLSYFEFSYDQKFSKIEKCHSKQFQVSVGLMKKAVSDLNAVIEFITGIEKPNSPKKRKAKVVE